MTIRVQVSADVCMNAVWTEDLVNGSVRRGCVRAKPKGDIRGDQLPVALIPQFVTLRDRPGDTAAAGFDGVFRHEIGVERWQFPMPVHDLSIAVVAGCVHITPMRWSVVERFLCEHSHRYMLACRRDGSPFPARSVFLLRAPSRSAFPRVSTRPHNNLSRSASASRASRCISRYANSGISLSATPLLHIALDEPRDGCYPRVGGPYRFVAVAIEAGAPRQHPCLQ